MTSPSPARLCLQQNAVLASLIVSGSLRRVTEDQIPRETPDELEAGRIIRDMPNAPPIRFRSVSGDYGRYSNLRDEVRINSAIASKRLRFPVIFHELAHSTQHRSRLDREIPYPKVTYFVNTQTRSLRAFGDPKATRVIREINRREEIIAELASLYLCLRVGMFWGFLKIADDHISRYLGMLAKTSVGRAAVLVPLHQEALRVVDYILGNVASRKAAA